MNQLCFSLLGPVRAWFGDHEIALGSPQQRALLAVLLLRVGEPVSNDDAVRALWGDTAPKSADGTIRTYVYRLRRKITEVVGTDRLALRSHSGGYLLTAGDATIDADLFERELEDARRARTAGDAEHTVALFRTALARWHGVPLAGVDTAYFNTERKRLEQLRAAGVAELAEAEIGAGKQAAAVTTLKVALAAEPLQERLWELLLRALSGLGRRADALSAYQEARRTLRTELGLEPGPRLQELHRDILDVAPATTPMSGSGEPDMPPPARLTTTAHGFVGRAAELSELTTRLTDAGEPALVGVTGAANLGKTALAVRAAQSLRPHFPDGRLYAVLTTPDGMPRPPAAVLVDLLRGLGVPTARLPRELGELASLWQRTVDRKRVLIVLDDARDAGQVMPALPNSPVPSVLITSRQQLIDVPGLRMMPLGGLTLADALQLLGSLVGHRRLHQDVEAAARLVATCAYRPDVVRTAAATLLECPHRTLRDVTRELSTDRHPASADFAPHQESGPDTDPYNVRHLTGYRLGQALVGA